MTGRVSRVVHADSLADRATEGKACRLREPTKSGAACGLANGRPRILRYSSWNTFHGLSAELVAIPSMDLMKRPLTQQRDELAVGQRAGPNIRVQVDDTAARRPEPLVVAAELRPELPGEEQGIALGHRGKPAAGGGAGEDGYVEKPVTIVCPIDAVEQAILLLLVVAQRNAPGPESPDQDGSPWRRSRAGGGGGAP